MGLLDFLNSGDASNTDKALRKIVSEIETLGKMGQKNKDRHAKIRDAKEKTVKLEAESLKNQKEDIANRDKILAQLSKEEELLSKLKNRKKSKGNDGKVSKSQDKIVALKEQEAIASAKVAKSEMDSAKLGKLRISQEMTILKLRNKQASIIKKIRQKFLLLKKS